LTKEEDEKDDVLLPPKRKSSICPGKLSLNTGIRSSALSSDVDSSDVLAPTEPKPTANLNSDDELSDCLAPIDPEPSGNTSFTEDDSENSLIAKLPWVSLHHLGSSDEHSVSERQRARPKLFLTHQQHDRSPNSDGSLSRKVVRTFHDQKIARCPYQKSHRSCASSDEPVVIWQTRTLAKDNSSAHSEESSIHEELSDEAEQGEMDDAKTEAVLIPSHGKHNSDLSAEVESSDSPANNGIAIAEVNLNDDSGNSDPESDVGPDVCITGSSIFGADFELEDLLGIFLPSNDAKSSSHILSPPDDGGIVIEEEEEEYDYPAEDILRFRRDQGGRENSSKRDQSEAKSVDDEDSRKLQTEHGDGILDLAPADM
jgi:hypothetical protein